MTNATLGSSIDDEVGNLEKALCDILGIPIDTDIANALFSGDATGLLSLVLTTLNLRNASANPVNAGDIQRNNTRLLWHNTERAVELQPAGEIKIFFGPTPPVGWLLCDGAAYSRATYARLFASIGILGGPGDGSTTFNVPDFRGLTLIGQAPGGDVAFDTIGKTGGEKTHTLTEAEMPIHTHAATVSDPTHAHTTSPFQASVGPLLQFGSNIAPAAGVTGASATGISVSNANAGSGVAHNNLPPYRVAAVYIST